MSECFKERSKRKRKKEERERHEVFKWSVGLKDYTTQEHIVDGLSKQKEERWKEEVRKESWKEFYRFVHGKG